MNCVLLAPGSQNGTKIAKKSIQNSIIFMMRLGIDFRTGFGGSSKPKWNQVGTKIYQKGTKITFLCGNVGRPSVPRCHPGGPETISRRPKNVTFVPFWYILVPTWFHFGLELPPKPVRKLIPRRIIKMIVFWIDFLAIVVLFWEPGANKTHFIFDSVFNWALRADLDGPTIEPQSRTHIMISPTNHITWQL